MLPEPRTERRPGGQTGPVAEEDHQGAGSLTTLPVGTDPRAIAWDVSDLPPAMQARVTRAWTDGYAAGINAGRAAVVREDAEAWARMREVVHAAARAPDYATLAERRGQRERAAATRRLWAERGIA